MITIIINISKDWFLSFNDFLRLTIYCISLLICAIYFIYCQQTYDLSDALQNQTNGIENVVTKVKSNFNWVSGTDSVVGVDVM